MKKLLVIGAATLATAGAVGAISLSASALATSQNRQASPMQQKGMNGKNGRQASLESRAKIVGMTATELEKALQTKTMSQIAKEKGLSEADFKSKMTEAAKARWQARGFSSEEITKRLADREKRQAANASTHEWGAGAGSRHRR